jgi:hypothetical protein
MSWLFSRVLVEEYLGGSCSDGEQSAPSNGNPIPQAYCAPDKMTAFSRLSRFGMMFAPLMEDRGAELLTSYLGAFRARTSALPEREQGSRESDQECGDRWRGSLARFDPATSLWRTAQHSLLEDSESCSVTWPRSGMTRDGQCWELPTLGQTIKGTESGLLPTPNARDWKDSQTSGNRKSPNLGVVAHWPTPRTKGMCGGSGSWDLLNKNTTVNQARLMGAGNGGQLNPTWVEWLMGWPLEWTDLKPLATDKCPSAPQQHGDF